MFLDAFVNVLAIIAIIAVGAFLMVFIGDLLLNVIDRKQGIFFKRNNRIQPDNSPLQPTQILSDIERAELLRLQELYRARYTNTPNVPVNLPQQPEIPKVEDTQFTKNDFDDYLKDIDKQNPIDYTQAKHEENLLKEKLAAKLSSQEKMSKENVFKTVDDISDQVLSNYESEKTRKQVINDYSKELNKYSIDDIDTSKILNTYEEDDEDEEDDKKDKNVSDIFDTEDDDFFKDENEDEVEQDENDSACDNIKLDEKEAENKKLRLEIANLQKALLEQKAVDLEVDDISLQMYTSVEACEAKIAQLEERLKEARKALKTNNKEYKPLLKVRKNISKYKERLHRKEVLIARQKIALYGVNNYGDIDKEKAEKLANDIELYDGLKLSVQDCENVIENSKDRYPTLEQANKILLSTIINLESDLEEANNVLKKLKEKK